MAEGKNEDKDAHPAGPAEKEILIFIEPGSPWENGYVESFNGKLRD